jgi:hypothetical protein
MTKIVFLFQGRLRDILEDDRIKVSMFSIYLQLEHCILDVLRFLLAYIQPVSLRYSYVNIIFIALSVEGFTKC